MRRIRLTQAMKMDMPLIVGDAGDELTLPDYVAQFAVRQGNAIYLDSAPKPPPTRAELEAHETAMQGLRKIGEASSQPSEPEEVKRPYGNAPKSAWVRYACYIDENMTEERAEGMTKADLMSRFGERLL